MEIKIRHVWKQVFSKPGYLVLGLIIAILFYILNVIIQNYITLLSFYKAYGLSSFLPFLSRLTFGFHRTIESHSTITLVITAILLGMLVSLLVFKTKTASSKTNTKAIGTLAIFFGLLAPGCAACGLGLVAALGLSSIVLTFLPFKGLEISILAILILGFAIFKTSKDLTICEVCKVNLENVTLKKLKGGQK